jgi:hypothetical protein
MDVGVPVTAEPKVRFSHNTETSAERLCRSSINAPVDAPEAAERLGRRLIASSRIKRWFSCTLTAGLVAN